MLLHARNRSLLLLGFWRAFRSDEPTRIHLQDVQVVSGGWANSSGWDLKDLMAYVGWRDVDSAMRYLDSSAELQERFERGL